MEKTRSSLSKMLKAGSSSRSSHLGIKITVDRADILPVAVEPVGIDACSFPWSMPGMMFLPEVLLRIDVVVIQNQNAAEDTPT